MAGGGVRQGSGEGKRGTSAYEWLMSGSYRREERPERRESKGGDSKADRCSAAEERKLDSYRRDDTRPPTAGDCPKLSCSECPVHEASCKGGDKQ